MAIIILIVLFLGDYFSGCSAGLPSKLNGGIKIDTNNFNYHVSVQYLQRHICSGSIISTSHILTSANCVVLEIGDDIVVMISNLQILTDTTDKLDRYNRGRIHKISYAFIHEKYDEKNFWMNDIAILKTEKSFTYTPTCSKIDISNKFIRTRTLLLMTGWSDDSDNNELVLLSNYLQVTSVKVLSLDDCRDKFNGFRIFSSYEICAEASSGATFSSGDSGNPLIFRDRIMGITSVLTLRNTDTIIITRTLVHKFWIESILSKYSSV